MMNKIRALNRRTRLIAQTDLLTSLVDANCAPFRGTAWKFTTALLLAPLAFLTAPSAGASDCHQTSVGLIPLTDGGSVLYLDTFPMGLYPDGSSSIPAPHASAGQTRAESIQPLDVNGNPDPNGKYILLSIGMSNTRREFSRFQDIAVQSGLIEQDHLVLVNGAMNGQTADRWAEGHQNYDLIRDEILTPAGLSESQVCAVWLKVAHPRPSVSLPSSRADAYELLEAMGDIVRKLRSRYPNLVMVLNSSRIYAGYVSVALNPEPFAYESGFAVKWLVESQINQMAGSEPNPLAGDLNYNSAAPWLAWGPYMWADGLEARSDGLTWRCEDFDDDGTHPSAFGEEKVGNMLFDFFAESAFTRPWFLENSSLPGDATVAVTRPNGGETFLLGALEDITWDVTGDVGNGVDIKLTRGSRTLELKTGAPNNGLFEWAVPQFLQTGSDYRVQVTDSSNPDVTDSSDAGFTISDSLPSEPITVTRPNGGEVFRHGTTEAIRWTSDESVGSTIEIVLVQENRSRLIAVAPNTGEYEWPIPPFIQTAPNYKVQIRDGQDTSVADVSDASFTITDDSH